MNSRENILRRLRTELASGPVLPPPSALPVWPQENPPVAELAQRFIVELEAVDGEVLSCNSADDARNRLSQLMETEGWQSIAVVDDPLCRALVGDIAQQRIALLDDSCQKQDIAQLPVGLVAAELLLADTGTCVVAGSTAQNRLVCYLPQVCLVAARVEQLTEHMSAAWEQIARRVAEPNRRGELVLVTGPSRTADIEKYLVLGVHGPRRVVVLLIG